MLKKCYLFLIFIIFLFSILAVSAEEIENNTIVEDKLESISFNELQDEIDSIEDGGILDLTENYESESFQRIIINKSLTINGNGHIIDGLNHSGIFEISNSNVVLKNINFINGAPKDDSFAIDLNNADVKIINCTFKHNLGAISSIDSNLNISNSTFSFNAPIGIYTSGGAIFAEDSMLNVEDSAFFNNSASEGGAIYCFNSTLNVNNSDFYSNNVTFYGGAIFSDSPLRISHSRLYKNKAQYKGGAIHTTYSFKREDSSLYIDASELFENSAQYGGGVSSSNKNHVIINNSRIYENSALAGGVITRFSQNSIEIINTTCFKNAATNGSVVYSPAGGNIIFINSDLKNNTGDFGGLIYSLVGRFCKNFDDFNISIVNSNLADNDASKELIRSISGNVIICNSSITYKNQSYDIPVIYKLIWGNVTQENNWWGVENPDLDKLIVFDLNQLSFNASEGANQSEDCASGVVQIDEENFTFTFRRDSTYDLCVCIIKQDEGVLQYKSDTTYFIHAFISDNGWAFGNGGLDTPFTSEKAEAYAKTMSRNNMIIDELIYRLYDFKTKGTSGHFLVKAPNGTYALLGHFTNPPSDIIEKGVLKSGEYLVIPNNPQYFKKGNLSDLNISDRVSASRYVLATDGYGASRTNEFTYDFITDVFKGKYVDVYVANDDGSLSNKSDTSLYFNDIFMNDTYVFGEDVPLIMDGMYLGRMIINEGNLKINAPDVTKYYNGGERFVVTLTDNEDNPLANKTVTISINGVAYTRNTDENGTASIGLRLNSGTYNATVTAYNRNMTSIVTILPTLNATDIVKVFRNATQFYATFLDGQGNYLAERTVITFNINGVYYNRTVEANGLAKLNINLEAGNYIITSVNTVTGENAANNVTVIPRIIENRDITKYYKNGTQYAVKVIDDNGKAVGEGETVTFNVNGILYNRTTNESGIAKLNINLHPGDYIITAEYEGCRVSNNISVLPVLTAKDLTKKYGARDQFFATLVDGQGKPYANQTVTFNIHGVLYNRITDSSGQAKLNINLMPGEYIITSSYSGTNVANRITVKS